MDERLLQCLVRHPYPLVFATISGAHLYGFPSADSDFYLRGVHMLPLPEVVGLQAGRETVECSEVRDGLEIDLVTHDARKFFGLLLRPNGYVLEQLLSPLVLWTSPEHEELKAVTADCVTRHHAHHYLGFAATQWNLVQKESPPRVKPLLYVYRVLLTGIHLMRTGQIEANLESLNAVYRLPFLPDLISRKRTGAENGALELHELEFHAAETTRLRSRLEQEFASSSLPEQPRAAAALNDLLIRLRLEHPGGFAW